MNELPKRLCPLCKEEKPLLFFPTTRSGYMPPNCKACVQKKNKAKVVKWDSVDCRFKIDAERKKPKDRSCFDTLFSKGSRRG